MFLQQDENRPGSALRRQRRREREYIRALAQESLGHALENRAA